MIFFSKRINWRIALLIFLLSSIVSPLFSTLIRGYVGLIPLIVIGISLVLTDNKDLSYGTSTLSFFKLNRTMFFTLVWYIIGVSITFFRGANDYQYFISILVAPVYLFSGIFLSTHQMYKDLAITFILMLIFINILLTGQSIGQEESARQIYSDTDLNLTSGFWALIAIYFPKYINILIKQKNTLSIFIYAIPIVYLVYKLFFSGFATPIALLLINLSVIGILYLFFLRGNVRTFFKVLFIFVSLLTTVYFVFNFLLLSNIVAIEAVSWRFNNFIEDPFGGGYDDLSGGFSRFDLMDFSWATFTHSILFGAGGNIRTSIYEGVAGGHSSSVDLLAVMGLLGGGGSFLLFMLIGFKNAYKSLKNRKDFNTVSNLSVVISMMIGGVMNPYWSGPILMCYLLLVNIYKLD